MKELIGKVALVTGAAQGIGEAIAKRLAEAGAKVCFSDINVEKAVQAARKTAEALQLQYDVDVVGTKVDVSNSSEVQMWIESIVSKWKRIDILVNNAGIQLNQASADLTDEEWSKVMRINLDGVFYCSREVGKVMLKQNEGNIINLSSIAEKFGMARRLPYAVAKAGITAMTRVLSVEWAAYGIRVNAIAPGYVETELNRHAFAQGHIKRDEVEAKIPMKHLADPSEIAESVLFLASKRAGYITGQVLYVDGGYSITK